MTRKVRMHLLFIVCAFIGSSAVRSEAAVLDEKTQALPVDADAWIGSPPLGPDTFAGKAVMFFLFEEQCPHVRNNNWPKWLELAKQHANDPIIFVGVNSGNSTDEVRRYVREVGITWPVVTDADRAFEKAVLPNEISLKNINQIVVRLPDGTWAHGSWEDPGVSAKSALAGAAWKLDPTTIAESLRPAWRQIELGNYAAASKPVLAAADSSDLEEQASAQKLLEFVGAELNRQVAGARQRFADGDKWGSYKQLQAITVQFNGFPLPDNVLNPLKVLGSDESVKRELAAAKQWNAIRNGPKPKTANAFKAVVAQVERFVKQYPDTDAGREAQSALDRAVAQQ